VVQKFKPKKFFQSKPCIFSDEGEPSGFSHNSGDYFDGTEPLIKEFSVKEDMNKEGMKKAKKFSVVQGNPRI